MKFKLFDSVVLAKDLAEEDLRAGTPGVVVDLLGPEAVIIEFFDPATDETVAVIDLDVSDLRTPTPDEVKAREATRARNNAAAR